MTREHVLVLGLDEIQGIRWQCDACKTAMSFKLDEKRSIPQRCPGCNAIFVEGKNFSEYEAVTQLIEAVQFIRETADNKTLRATLKLEFIDGP